MASNATAFVIPPGQLEVIDGRRVYRSRHTAGVINDDGVDINYTLSATLSDSLGNQQNSSLPQTAPGQGSQSSVSDEIALELSANLYNPGDEITFTCTTTVSGGVSDFATATNMPPIT